MLRELLGDSPLRACDIERLVDGSFGGQDRGPEVLYPESEDLESRRERVSLGKRHHVDDGSFKKPKSSTKLRKHSFFSEKRGQPKLSRNKSCAKSASDNRHSESAHSGHKRKPFHNMGHLGA